jgi:FSR family fosmidomycin resistance protein-like MFS transporter
MEHRRSIALMATGHGSADLCQGAVPALLPFLIADRGLSLTAATALLSAATIGSSIVQPLFGLWADRLSAPVLVPAGVAIGSIGIGAVGLCHSYVALALILAVSGLGVAAFHPEGARMVNRLSTPSTRGRAMSYFSVGGNAGFAVGPVLVTLVVGLLGLSATPLLALPGLAVAVALAVEARRIGAAPATGRAAAADASTGGGAAPVERWGAFARLSTAAVARTVVFFAMQAFVPIYLVEHFGSSTTLGNGALTLLLASGAAGTLIGGRCADRFGRKVVLVYAMAPAVVVLLALPHLGAVAFVAALIAIGLLLDGPFSTTVVLGQEYLPGRVGLASGITLGLAIGLGGLGATGLGALADATSIPTALELLPLFGLAALMLAMSLPETVRARRASRRSAPAATPPSPR